MTKEEAIQQARNYIIDNYNRYKNRMEKLDSFAYGLDEEIIDKRVSLIAEVMIKNNLSPKEAKRIAVQELDYPGGFHEKLMMSKEEWSKNPHSNSLYQQSDKLQKLINWDVIMGLSRSIPHIEIMENLFRNSELIASIQGVGMGEFEMAVCMRLPSREYVIFNDYFGSNYVFDQWTYASNNELRNLVLSLANSAYIFSSVEDVAEFLLNRNGEFTEGNYNWFGAMNEESSYLRSTAFMLFNKIVNAGMLRFSFLDAIHLEERRIQREHKGKIKSEILKTVEQADGDKLIVSRIARFRDLVFLTLIYNESDDDAYVIENRFIIPKGSENIDDVNLDNSYIFTKHEISESDDFINNFGIKGTATELIYELLKNSASNGLNERMMDFVHDHEKLWLNLDKVENKVRGGKGSSEAGYSIRSGNSIKYSKITTLAYDLIDKL